LRQGRRRGRYRPVCNAGWRRWPNPVSAKRVALPAVAVKSDCINSNNTFVRNASGVVPIGFGLGCGEKPGVDGGAEREGEEEGRSGEAGDFSADREDDLATIQVDDRGVQYARFGRKRGGWGVSCVKRLLCC